MIYAGSKERMQAHVLQSFRDFFCNPVRYPSLDRRKIGKEAAGRHKRRCFTRNPDSFLHRHSQDHNVRRSCVQDCSRFDLHLLGSCPSLVDLSTRQLDFRPMEAGEPGEETPHSAGSAHDQDSCLVKALRGLFWVSSLGLHTQGKNLVEYWPYEVRIEVQ